MRKTNKSTGGTSFHDTVVGTTIHTLNKLIGEPTYVDNTGMDKVNYEWEMETSDGDVFTVYSWKEIEREEIGREKREKRDIQERKREEREEREKEREKREVEKREREII